MKNKKDKIKINYIQLKDADKRLDEAFNLLLEQIYKKIDK